MKYKVITLSVVDSHIESNLNAWSKKGWRLVSTIPITAHQAQYILEKEFEDEDF